MHPLVLTLFTAVLWDDGREGEIGAIWRSFKAGDGSRISNERPTVQRRELWQGRGVGLVYLAPTIFLIRSISGQGATGKTNPKNPSSTPCPPSRPRRFGWRALAAKMHRQDTRAQQAPRPPLPCPL